MAEVDEAQFSLMSLEDELTCSICLSPFDCPVTIPCGHNFCQDCLLESWKDSYSCPQCRTLFATKPELKKNTVLTAVVETFKVKSSRSEDSSSGDESEAVSMDVIRCDACMEAEALQTCLTCMASYCEEHLRPHRENAVFRLHQLSEPVGDLSELICPDHHKLMELFCSQHERLICSFCLQQVHKGCPFVTPEEQRNVKESDLRNKLGLLNEKMEKTETVVLQMNNMQSKLKDAANKRKTALAAVYQQMRDILAQDEREAQNEVDRELELGQMKLRDLTKKLTENYDTMGKTSEDINSLLSQSRTSAFLQASVELPKVVKFEPHVPRINLDSKKVTATQAFAAALRETLMEMLKQPVEARLPLLKAELYAGSGACGDSGEAAASVSGPESAEHAATQPESAEPSEQKSSPMVPGPLCHPPVQPIYQPVHIPVFIRPQQSWSAPHYPQAQPRGQPRFFAQQKTNQDRKPHGAAGGSKPAGKGSDFTKKEKPKDQGRKPHGAAGGSKPAGKDKPKGHPPSAKSSTHHPHPHKNQKK